MATRRDPIGPVAGPGAEPAGGAVPSKRAFPIGTWTLSGDPHPCGSCGKWVKPNAQIPDGASIAETDLLLRRASMKGCCSDEKAMKGGNFTSM